jgi:phage terminase large subunit
MTKRLFDLVDDGEDFVEDFEFVEDEDIIQCVEDSPFLPEDHLTETSTRPTLPPLETLTTCPRCHKTLVNALALDGSESAYFKECPSCGTLVNTFRPLPYQADFMSNPARDKMSAGGYGSGKSTCNIQYVIKHLLLIPGASVCVCARTYPAIEPTFLQEFKRTFPEKLKRSYNDNKKLYTFTNGSTLIIRSFDDPTKLKSMNLTLAVIIEASDVPESGFSMFKSRIRNTKAMIPAYDNNGKVITYPDPKNGLPRIKYRVDARHILLETNPASNWVKKFLEQSKTVAYYGSAKNDNYNMSSNPNPDYYTQVIPTDANPYLPETYVEELSRDRSDAWIAQFIYGSFNFNDGLVFPNAGLCIVEPHELPRAYDDYGKRVLFFAIGLDYGISDPTHIVYTAYSTETKKLYVYDELRLNNADVRTIAREYRRNTRTNGTDLDHLLMMPRFDGRSYNKRESDLYTIGGAFEAAGLFFEPSFANHDIRIIKMNSLINHNQIEIYSTCVYLIEEILNYGFIKDKEGRPTNKPKDGNDHGITALEFVVVELPHNLQELNLSAYIPAGTKYIHDKEYNKPLPKRKPKVYNPLEIKEDTYDTNICDSFHHSLGPVFYARDYEETEQSDERRGARSEDRTEDEDNRRLRAYTPDFF